jgi:hypothetical protein
MEKQVQPNHRFLHGVFTFEGRGLEAPAPLSPPVLYTVPSDKRAQLIYMRGGNSSEELIYLALMRDEQLMRLFPIGAKASVHVSLAVVEDIFPDSRLEVFVAAPKGLRGSVVFDFGLLEAD